MFRTRIVATQIKQFKGKSKNKGTTRHDLFTSTYLQNVLIPARWIQVRHKASTCWVSRLSLDEWQKFNNLTWICQNCRYPKPSLLSSWWRLCSSTANLITSLHWPWPCDTKSLDFRLKPLAIRFQITSLQMQYIIYIYIYIYIYVHR